MHARPARVPAAVGGRTGERVAGDGRADDVERVHRVTAVRRGVGEQRDDGLELDERSGPAVRDDERERPRLGRARRGRSGRGAVDLAREVFELVQAGLGLAPVVGVTPVADELAEVPELGAVVPLGTRDLLREARPPRGGRAGPRGRPRECRRGTARSSRLGLHLASAPPGGRYAGWVDGRGGPYVSR